MTRPGGASRRWRRRHRLWPVAALPFLLVSTLALPAAVAAPTLPAAPGADPDQSPVLVAVDDLTPVAPRPGDTLVVSGTLTNTGATDLRTVSVRLRISPQPLVNRAEIGKIVTGREQREGDIVWSTQTTLAPELAAGASVAYRILLPVDSLGLSSTRPAVEIISVEALGDLVPGDGIGAQRVGITTTFLPWFPVPKAVTPTDVVWLVPLTDPPAQDSTGTLLDDTIGTDVSAGGRLRNLLDLTSRSPVPLTYLVDPALLATLSHMAGGYQVRQPGGDLSPGTAGAAAASWLAELKAAVAGPEATLEALPYALPDDVALHRAGLDLDITRAVTEAAARVTTVLGRAPAGTMAWPAGGVTNSGTLDLLRATGAGSVLLSSAAYPTDEHSTTTPDGVAPLGAGAGPEAVLADNRLTATLQMPTATPGQALLARQRLLAELAATTLEDPSVARTVVVGPPPTWSPDPATMQAWLSALQTSPWMRGVGLAQLLGLSAAQGDGPARSLADYRPRDRRAELPQSYLERVSHRRTDLAAFQAITSSPADARSTAIEDGLARTESQLWRTDLDGGRELLAAVGADLDGLVAQVRVVSRGTTTFPGENGVVPVVVANDLDQPVRVGLRLAGTPAIRFSADPYPAFTIAPGTKSSIEVPARVLGSGDVDVEVSLTTPDGRPYGTPALLVVRSTAYARAAGWVVGGLLALLVVLLAVNFVRRRRGPRPPPAPAADAPAPPQPPLDAGTPAGERDGRAISPGAGSSTR